VRVGKRPLVTEDSVTDTVLRVPGEFLSKDEALLAAKRSIDATDPANRNRQASTKTPPR
jgi:hypothetical protein